MAYIGKTPTIGNFQVCDAISVVNNQAAYTMQVGGVNVSPESSYHMIVSLNGVIQNPKNSFTVASSTITFASNLVTGDVIDFIQILGNVLDLGVPSDNTVTTAKLADSSVSLAKLTATGTKDATTFLRGDNTFQTVSSYTDSDALSLFNASGSAPVYACRAWVQYNAASAIVGSGNVSSITDNATGNNTVNFATNMPDANYAVVTAAQEVNTNSNIISAGFDSLSTSSVQIFTASNSGGGLDVINCIGVFR